MFSIIPKPSGSIYIHLHSCLVNICDDNPVAALLLSFFEGWHEYKLAAIEDWEKQKPRSKAPDLWQHHTMKELIEGLMGAAGRHSIEKAREILISKGFITMQRNPDPKFSFDATMHYLLNVDVVCKALFPNADFDKSGALVKISKIRVAEICKSEFAENSEAIPYTSTNTSTKSSPPASGQGDKLQKPPAKKTAPTPPREAPPPPPVLAGLRG